MGGYMDDWFDNEFLIVLFVFCKGCGVVDNL